MKYAWPILALFGARFFATAIFVPNVDGDLPWQRWLGQTIVTTSRLPRSIGAETFTAPGAAWVPQEWLFSLVAALSNGAGWYLFVSVAAFAAVAALALSALRAERSGVTPLALVAALTFAGLALFQSFGVRVQVIAWPLLAAFLYLLEVDSPLAYGAIAVAAVWSNVHASVLLAAPLALAAAAGSFADGGWSVRTKRTLVIAVGSLAATCCNPLGTDLPRYAIALFSHPFKLMIEEWKPTNLAHGSFEFGALPLLLAIVAFGINGEHRWRDRFLCVTAALLMFGAVRNVPVFALVVFPIVARSLAASGTVFSRPDKPPQTRADALAARLFPLLSGVLAVVFACILIGQSHRNAHSEDADVQAALAVVGRLPGTRRVLCEDFAWCNGFVAGDRDRVFIDGRADPYPQRVWDDYIAIITVKPGWHAKLRAHGTDVVIAAISSPLEAVMNLSSDWRSTYANHTLRVWTLAAPPHSPFDRRVAPARGVGTVRLPRAHGIAGIASL